MNNWQKDLQRGHAGEALISAKYPSLLPSGTLAYDFVDAAGNRYETKTDYTKYSNVFLETISNDNKNTPGGALQSLFKHVDYYVYQYEKRGLILCYAVNDLVWFLFNNMHKYDLKTIANKGYNTKGYAIPRADLAHLEIKLEEVIK